MVKQISLFNNVKAGNSKKVTKSPVHRKPSELQKLYARLKKSGLADEKDIQPKSICCDVYLSLATGSDPMDMHSAENTYGTYVKWWKSLKDGHYYELNGTGNNRPYKEPTDITANMMKQMLNPKAATDKKNNDGH